MKHIQTFESFLNEARAIKVVLTPEMFSEKTGWGIYKGKDTGCSTWKWQCERLIDYGNENVPGERNVVMIEVSSFPNGTCYAKVGITNSLKKEPSATMGGNYSFTREDAESDIKKVSSEAATFLMDSAHFRFISMNITSDGQSMAITPKGNFDMVIAKVIEASLKDK